MAFKINLCLHIHCSTNLLLISDVKLTFVTARISWCCSLLPFDYGHEQFGSFCFTWTNKSAIFSGYIFLRWPWGGSRIQHILNLAPREKWIHSGQGFIFGSLELPSSKSSLINVPVLYWIIAKKSITYKSLLKIKSPNYNRCHGLQPLLTALFT